MRTPAPASARRTGLTAHGARAVGARALADIVDIKPLNMEELTEVITAADFHPSHCNQFVYSSSKGTVKLCDMRLQALCDNHAKGACARARPTTAGSGPRH